MATKNCGYCKGVILAAEENWPIDGVPLHVTKRPGATDPKDTCYWAYKRQERVRLFTAMPGEQRAQ